MYTHNFVSMHGRCRCKCSAASKCFTISKWQCVSTYVLIRRTQGNAPLQRPAMVIVLIAVGPAVPVMGYKKLWFGFFGFLVLGFWFATQSLTNKGERSGRGWRQVGVSASRK